MQGAGPVGVRAHLCECLEKVCRGIDESLLTLHQSYCQPLGEKRALQLIRDIGAAGETLSGQE